MRGPRGSARVSWDHPAHLTAQLHRLHYNYHYSALLIPNPHFRMLRNGSPRAPSHRPAARTTPLSPAKIYNRPGRFV